MQLHRFRIKEFGAGLEDLRLTADIQDLQPLTAGRDTKSVCDALNMERASLFLTDQGARLGNTSLHKFGLNLELLMRTQVHYGLERQVTR